MKEQNRKLLYQQLEMKFGRMHQIGVAVGELGELVNALSKALRGKHDDMKIAEEMADVEICLEQMAEFYDHDGTKRELFRRFKLERLAKFYIEGDHA
jgi:NTP pyrophosphatase (non-canonical NTP hydrolase)